MVITERDGISALKGVGTKKTEALYGIGIATVGDLLAYLPYAYKDRGVFVDFASCTQSQRALLRAVYTGEGSSGYSRRGLSRSTLLFDDGKNIFKAVFYNQPYIKTSLKKGAQYRLYGTLYKASDGLVLVSPQLEREDIACYLKEGIYPLYSLPVKSGIKQKEFCRYIASALQNTGLYEYMPFWIHADLELPSRKEALFKIHLPLDEQDAYSAMRYFKAEKFIKFFIALNKKHACEKQEKGVVFKVSGTEELLSLFEFKPTEAQLKAIGEIKKDVSSGKKMNRLLQGDVGSGKTLVAITACYLAAKNAHQAVFCAPTEILAKQHYEKYSGYLKACGIESAVLYSAMNKKERNVVKELISSGKAQVVFGTHALFSDDINYRDLAMVVIDEQHRYGVGQRAKLELKGNSPHVLVMSATPIPRTLALSLYKDLDLSVMDALPSGRLPIKTYIIDPSQDNSAYRAIKRAAEKGYKAFIVCPAIDSIDMQNVNSVYEEAVKALSPLKVEYITGEMKEAEKDKVMNNFAYGDTSVLISTTVIEVGIDVKQAAIMWIKDSGRFGLAQLHQLRGRVGRNDVQSYCFLQTDAADERTMRRLGVLASTNDGYEIAGADMKMRGSGEIYGYRQSGKGSGLLEDALDYADLFMAADIISQKLATSRETQDELYYKYLSDNSDETFGDIAMN